MKTKRTSWSWWGILFAVPYLLVFRMPSCGRERIHLVPVEPTECVQAPVKEPQALNGRASGNSTRRIRAGESRGRRDQRLKMPVEERPCLVIDRPVPVDERKSP
jgi:hypothetical protein